MGKTSKDKRVNITNKKKINHPFFFTILIFFPIKKKRIFIIEKQKKRDGEQDLLSN